MIGALAVVAAQLRSALRVGGLTFYYIGSRRWDRRAILEQMFSQGNRSLFFVVLTLGFLGAIIILQTGFQAMRIFGDASLVGAQTLPMMVRQMGPTLAGLMVATRVGTGIAASIGSMVVTEQVDALRMCNAPPTDYLIKPRVLAGVVMVPVLVVVGIASAFVAGMITAQTVFHVNPATFANFDYVGLLDLAEGLSKSVAFGVLIPILAGASGLDARGGSEGVGEATTRAVVNTCLMVIMVDFFFGGLFFLVRV